METLGMLLLQKNIVPILLLTVYFINLSRPELQNSINRKILKANPRFNSSSHSSRDRDLSERIKPELDRIDQLAQAKVELAERLVAILTRTCGRLDYDLNRVRIASGEIPVVPDPPQISIRVPEKVVMESIKTAITIPESAPSPPPIPVASPAFKSWSNTPFLLSLSIRMNLSY